MPRDALYYTSLKILTQILLWNKFWMFQTWIFDHKRSMIFNPSFKKRQIYAAGQKEKTKHQVKYLKGVLSVQLTDITAKNVRAPDDGEVLRRHPGPL